MIVLAIDPGAHMGWAVVEGSFLIVCGLGLKSLVSFDCAAKQGIVEIPQYRGASQKAPVDDIIKLAYRAGLAVGAVGIPFETCTPSQWKGSVPKKIHNARVLASLSEASLRVYRSCTKDISPSLRNNVTDAVGLGVWYSKNHERLGM